jgi:hypothetical protein
VAGQVSEELFQFLFARKVLGHFQHGPQVAAEPETCNNLRWKSFVLSPDYFAHTGRLPVKGSSFRISVARVVGTKRSKGLEEHPADCPCNKRTAVL